MNELNLGGAWEASQGVMVGVSANFAFGSYRTSISVYEEVDTYNENTADQTMIVVLSDGSLFGFNRLLYEEGFETNLSGFNVRGGVSTTTLASGLRVGLLIETPTFYEISEDFITGNLPPGSMRAAHLNASKPDYKYEYELRTPWRIGGGASWEIGGFLLAGDLEYVDWSQMEFDGACGGRQPLQGFEQGSPGHHGPGLEYASRRCVSIWGYSPCGEAWPPIPIRFDRSASQGGEEADRDRRFVSAGVSYRFAQNFYLDAGWTRMKFNDEYTPYFHNVSDPPLVEESITQHRFLLGVRVGF